MLMARHSFSQGTVRRSAPETRRAHLRASAKFTCRAIDVGIEDDDNGVPWVANVDVGLCQAMIWSVAMFADGIEDVAFGSDEG
jgi:hypothetical protein